MAITKTIIVDKIEVVSVGSTYSSDDWKIVQARTASVIKEDGKEITRTFTRNSFTPGTVAAGSTALTPTNISGEEPIVQSIANAVWTADNKEAYRAYLVGIRSEGIG